jgi:hypothetical protein
LESFEKKEDNDAAIQEEKKDVVVQLGSQEYIQGMLTRPMRKDEPTNRVTGDKVLGPTLRLAGGVVGILVILIGAFLWANDII